MTKKQGLNEWWAIKSPLGILITFYIGENENYVQGDFLISLGMNADEDSWNILTKEGYRAVKIRITEIKEWGE